MKTKKHAEIILSVIAICLISCPIPINYEMLNNIHDSLDPRIEIFSPKEDTPCANVIELRGRVADQGSDGEFGRVINLSYEILGANITGQLSFTSDGIFKTILSTITLGPKFTLKVSATDWNNNTSDLYLSLQRDEKTGIPLSRQTLTPRLKENYHQITLEWNSINASNVFEGARAFQKEGPYKYYT